MKAPSPMRSGTLKPNRITSRSDTAIDAIPQMIVPGRNARPTSREL